ncbi:MAG TPA: 4-hydroxy-tetrahydrodipicolinate reductase [Myxococcaceae bacterium]|jgi:4-hydroxy-tetrahydrodipicolinate reductase|nr:4-hydroxy-tetrahydrodipicolinate reductase [Myxococcaceae bacterium]
MPRRVLVTGVTGRMGAAVVRALRGDVRFQLAGGAVRPGSGLAGQDAGTLAGLGPLGAPTFEDPGKAAAEVRPEVVIDFSHPEGTGEWAEVCGRNGTALVVGTTGLSGVVREQIDRAARSAAVVLSPNMSVGINVLLDVAVHLARLLGEAWDVEVLDLHHRQKRDAPSGTALRLAEVLARAAGRDASAFRLARAGEVGPRPPGEIGVQTLRGGDVVGEHTVYFLSDGERIEVTHRATSRDQFARGAVRAAAWACAQEPGLYTMQDVLGL